MKQNCELAFNGMQDTRIECILFFFILLLLYGKAQKQHYLSLYYIDFFKIGNNLYHVHCK